jgi:hypothetical protein
MGGTRRLEGCCRQHVSLGGRVMPGHDGGEDGGGGGEDGGRGGKELEWRCWQLGPSLQVTSLSTVMAGLDPATQPADPVSRMFPSFPGVIPANAGIQGAGGRASVTLSGPSSGCASPALAARSVQWIPDQVRNDAVCGVRWCKQQTSSRATEIILHRRNSRPWRGSVSGAGSPR